MNSSPVAPSQRNLYAVYVSIMVLLGGLIFALLASVPQDISNYVSNGFILPSSRYGVLFPLIAYGMILSGEYRSIAFVVNFAILGFATWFGLQHVGPAILSHPWGWLIVRYPILSSAMGLITGVILLLPLSARRWFIPVVSATVGLGLGLSIYIESPANEHAVWFSSAAGISGVAIAIASAAFASGAQRIGTGSWFAVAGRILGSWLIAASLMLAALAIIPKPAHEPAPAPPAIPEDIDLSRQP